MSRPRVNGPRSLTMTTTEAPVRGLPTLTLVPNGSDLCAAVRPSGRNGWPLAVDRLELYWVAFIEAPGQWRSADPAKAVSPDQFETNNRRTMIFNSIGDRSPVISTADAETPDELGSNALTRHGPAPSYPQGRGRSTYDVVNFEQTACSKLT